MRNNRPSARAIAQDKSGTSTIELALAAPLFAVLLTGMIDVTMGFSRKITLEQAAQRSIEMASVTSKMGSDYQYVRQEAADAANEPVEKVTLDRWLECDGVRQESFDGVCGDEQQVARYLSIRIDGQFKPMFGLVAGGAGYIPIKGDAAVRVQ